MSTETAESGKAILSAEEMAEIRARADAATAGPWTDDNWERVRPADGDANGSVDICHVYGHRNDREGNNRRFIAHARVDVPRLLDSHASLELHRDKLREACEAALELWGLANGQHSIYAVNRAAEIIEMCNAALAITAPSPPAETATP